LQNGPDEKNIARKALEEAAQNAGARFDVEDGMLTLEHRLTRLSIDGREPSRDLELRPSTSREEI